MPATAARKRKLLICAAITVFWLAMNAQLVRRELLLPTLPPARIGVGSTLAPGVYFKEQWMGIYYEGEKVGYSNTSINKFSGSMSPGYTIRNITYIVVSVLQNPVRVHFDGVLHTDENFKMQSFWSTIESADHKIRIDGAMEGDTLSLAVLSGSKVFRKKMKVSENLNLSNSLTPLMFLPDLEPGVTYSLDILNPLSFTTSKAKIAVTGVEPLEYMGKQVEAYVIETQYQGLSFKAWVTESGDVLKEASPLGWTLVREDRQVAEEFRADAVKFRKDLARFVAVPSNIQIEKPEDTTSSDLFISGIDFGMFKLDGAGQHLVNPETGLIHIDMHRPDPDTALKLPIDEDLPPEYLGSSLLIQSDDEAIKKTAARIAGDEKNSLIVAERINQWVYDNLKKKITFSLPSAVEVLETREGDCNEHTTLFVALARAAGIPSRIVVGLVYYKGSFYYHAWPEVYVGQWMAMDPTFGQSPADATHIRLLDGEFDEQVKLTQALGKIQLNIKSVSYPPPKAKEPV